MEKSVNTGKLISAISNNDEPDGLININEQANSLKQAIDLNNYLAQTNKHGSNYTISPTKIFKHKRKVQRMKSQSRKINRKK